MAILQYFAYGSNMLTERLQRRCKSAAYKGLARVSNYQFTFSKRSVDLSGKGNISTALGDQVFGALFDIDKSELPGLDRLEGLGYGYDRIDNFAVQLVAPNEFIPVITYVADSAYIDPSLKPYHWYFDLVVAGARQHDLPPEYVQRIEAVRSIEDPLPTREERLEAIELLEALPPDLYRRR